MNANSTKPHTKQQGTKLSKQAKFDYLFPYFPTLVAAYEVFNTRFSDFSEDTGTLGEERHSLLDNLLAEAADAQESYDEATSRGI